MPYDAETADRVRECLATTPAVSEKAMFGGLAFLVHRKMAVAVSGGGGLLLRCAPGDTDSLVTPPHVGRFLMRGREVLGADMEAGLAAMGLTGSRAPLVWLLHQTGPSTQSALATALRVTPRNITGLVDALVATGFVSRAPHPTDRRAVQVALTAHGTEVVATMARQHTALADTLFGDLDPTTFAAFRRGLDKVLESLHRALDAGTTP